MFEKSAISLAAYEFQHFNPDQLEVLSLKGLGKLLKHPLKLMSA
jgi:hypothetical protein